MIGWYVHHHGTGHLNRVRAVRPLLDRPVTVLSSLDRPPDWDDPWVSLPLDLDEDPRDPDAGGCLHWAPRHHEGLRRRMAAISAWIAEVAPEVLVCDVSVEVALLARLHGVPVVYVVMPGRRGDTPHRLVYTLAAELVAFWPGQAGQLAEGMVPRDLSRLHRVGALSRFPVSQPATRAPGPPRVTVLMGTGGDGLHAGLLEDARSQTPDWEWQVLARNLGTWQDDPFQALSESDVVVTHAGENALAEVAAARTPAVVIPQERPYDEQRCTAAALARGPWPAVVATEWPTDGWPSLLARARCLDGRRWASWCDGRAAHRFSQVVIDLVITAGGW